MSFEDGYCVYVISLRPGLFRWLERIAFAGELSERPKPMRSKIGFSGDVFRRKGQIRATTVTGECTLDATIPVATKEAAMKLERELHERFKAQWLREEWFRLSEEDILRLSLYSAPPEFVQERVHQLRTKEGVRVARAAGKRLGRPPVLALTREHAAIVSAWAAEEPRPAYKALAERLGCSLGKAHRLGRAMLGPVDGEAQSD